MPSAALAFIALHFAASLILAAFGLHRLRLALGYLRRVAGTDRIPPPPPPRLPSVTVQIPLYNERYVAERAILSAAALDYPRHLLELQVLDDSTDDTAAVVARTLSRLERSGLRIRHVRRHERCGFKAGALANGLTMATGELIAIFDADFIPPRDFLMGTVGEFSDPSVGMVQGRWGHLNADTSLLTRAQSLQLDAHFTVEHGVRSATGCFFNFNGTAGIWRRETIVAAGGWSADTLTEDLDLSYRAQLAGWRFVYRDDLEVLAELPIEIAAYRMQQERWAQGGVQTACKLLPLLARASLPRHVKREAFWHLTGHLAYPLLVVLALAALGASWVPDPVERGWVIAIDGVLLAFATTALSVFYGVAARGRNRAMFLRRLAIVPAIMVLGAGIALSQTAAVCRGLTRRTTPFRRTPKYRLGRERDGSWRSAVYRLSAPRAALAECLAGILVLATIGAQLMGGIALPVGAGLLLGAGFLAVGGGALAQQRGRVQRTTASPSFSENRDLGWESTPNDTVR